MFLKVLANIERAQKRQKKSFETRKKKLHKSYTVSVGQEVLVKNSRKVGRKGGQMEPNWGQLATIIDISEKGVATLKRNGKVQKQRVNISQLKPFRKREEGNAYDLKNLCNFSHALDSGCHEVFFVFYLSVWRNIRSL